jgi:ankyrin repeat protein
MRSQILVVAGTLCERDIPNNGGYTPLAWAIVQTHLDVAEFLLHSGAKMSNVKSRHKIPDWMKRIVSKRKNVILSTFTLKALLRKRFKVPGAEGAFLNGRPPKDVVDLVGFYVWATRLDPKWGEASEDGLRRMKK